MKKAMQTTISSDDIHSKHRYVFDERYHAFNKRILCAVGLWPSQPLKQKRVRAVGLLIVSLIVMVGQMRAIMRGPGEFNFIVECIIPIELNLMGIIKLINSMAHTQKMRKLCYQMQKYWDDMRHLPQINILEKYGKKGRRWTIFYFILLHAIVLTWITTAFAPRIMDALAPLNYSRRRLDLMPTDFMVDPEVYSYHILIPITIGLLYHVLANVAVDTLYMVLAQHVCGMFEILRYNLHNVSHNNKVTAVILKPNIHEDMHYHEIVSCIKNHKAITAYTKTMESTCEWKLFAVVVMSMLSLSFTGYMVVNRPTLRHCSLVLFAMIFVQAIMSRDDNVDTIRWTFFGIAQIVHLYCNTLPGHWIMDSSLIIPYSAYGCRWHMMSLRSRKLILFLIRASIEPCCITAGKLYVMSVENFSAVLRTSMSYFAMLNSIQ